MAKINEQLTLGDIDEEYQKFVDKFKPKKTTDDCYTPANIYEAVLSWVNTSAIARLFSFSSIVLLSLFILAVSCRYIIAS